MTDDVPLAFDSEVDRLAPVRGRGGQGEVPGGGLSVERGELARREVADERGLNQGDHCADDEEEGCKGSARTVFRDFAGPPRRPPSSLRSLLSGRSK